MVIKFNDGWDEGSVNVAVIILVERAGKKLNQQLPNIYAKCMDPIHKLYLPSLNVILFTRHSLLPANIILFIVSIVQCCQSKKLNQKFEKKEVRRVSRVISQMCHQSDIPVVLIYHCEKTIVEIPSVHI